MEDFGWADQIILVALYVGLIYGLCGLLLGYLALTDLEWRELIKERLQEEWRGLKLRLILAYLKLLSLAIRICGGWNGNRVK